VPGLPEQLPESVRPLYYQIRDFLQDIISGHQWPISHRDQASLAQSNLANLAWWIVEHPERPVSKPEPEKTPEQTGDYPELDRRYEEAMNLSWEIDRLTEKFSQYPQAHLVAIMQLQLLIEIRESMTKIEKRLAPSWQLYPKEIRPVPVSAVFNPDFPPKAS
jgi:hypothetical protein